MTGGTFNVRTSMQGAYRWMPFARKRLAIDAGVFGTGQHMAAVAVGVAFDDECSAHWGSFHPGTWAMKGFLPRCLVLMPLLAASGGLTITMPA